MTKKFDPRAPWLTPLKDRPVQRKHLAALDYMKGMTLSEIMIKHGYTQKGNVSRDVSKVLSQRQMEKRNKRFGRWHGNMKRSFRKPHMLERTVVLKKSGVTLRQIAKIEQVTLRTICNRLQRAKKSGLYDEIQI